MKRWIRASMPGPACLVQKPMVFAQEARHLRRRGTSLCLAIHSYRFMARGRASGCNGPGELVSSYQRFEEFKRTVNGVNFLPSGASHLYAC